MDHERPQLSSSQGANGASVPKPSVLPRACDNCRSRKIRCDKLSPCSSCQMVNLPCRVATRQSEERSQPRTAPISYHEKQFRLIHESLVDIKQKLRNLEETQHGPKVPVGSAAAAVEDDSTAMAAMTFQGESSFESHSAEASLSAELSARDAHGDEVASSINASLSSLKSLLQGRGQVSSGGELFFPLTTRPSPPKVELPPVAAVLAVLRRAAAHAPFVIVHSAQRDHSMLEELCKKIYFPTKPFSKGEITLMNGMLSFVFHEYSANPDASLSSSECKSYARLCEKNFTTGLQDYECLVTPKLENIHCLMIGAMKAQEDALPALCWTLVSAGARLCQILGYHREAVVSRDPPHLQEIKRHAFWMLYMIDKTLSLNLGRPSSFSDAEIDVGIFSPTKNPRFRPWDLSFLAFAEFSKLQGAIYDRLYTARAQRELPETRLSAVESLASKFHLWHEKFKEIDTTGAQDKSDLDLIIGCSDFIYYSALNLLYGAKTSRAAATHISAQRYQVAKLSLHCQIRNTEKLPSNDKLKWRIYSDWILLYSSFTPFLVVFTHSIASHSHEDVALLSQVLQTLEAPAKHSEAVRRLYKICSVFVEFAKAFVPSQQASFGFFNREENSFTFPVHENDINASSVAGDGFLVDAAVYGQDIALGGGEGFQGRNDDLDSMSAFLGDYLGANSGIGGQWSMSL